MGEDDGAAKAGVEFGGEVEAEVDSKGDLSEEKE